MPPAIPQESILATADDLLRRHSPRLVIFPNSPGRTRPGVRGPGAGGWGDYWPCAVESFLANATYRPSPRSYNPLRLLAGPGPLRPTPASETRRLVESAGPGATRAFELDLSAVPSQDEEHAWREYGRLVASEGPAPVAYGRFFRTASGGRAALQYWYLYLYNDFTNNHEGDWETAVIELAADLEPRRVGYSAHQGGFRRDWARTPRDGHRPLLYVARGSHAGYFGYRPGGWPVVGLGRVSGLPLVGRLPLLRRLRDFPPADPVLDASAPAVEKGVRLDPEILVVPEEVSGSPPAPPPGSDWWWLRFEGRWGSSRPRIRGAVGPESPWRQGLRWTDPMAWLDGLEGG